MIIYEKYVFYAILAGSLVLTACSSSYSLVSVEGGRVPITSVYDEQQDQAAWRILQPYQDKIDSLMTPVIGHSARKLEAYRPESPLSNLIADILCQSAEAKLGTKVDVGVMNIGGIRNILNEGNITFGSIYEISPFQNALSVVVLKGADLMELFKQIAAVHGEGLSGAQLVISKDGELLSARWEEVRSIRRRNTGWLPSTIWQKAMITWRLSRMLYQRLSRRKLFCVTCLSIMSSSVRQKVFL